MRFFSMIAALFVACSGAAPSLSPDSIPDPVLTPQQSGTTNLLQAVSVVNESVVWVSGHGGTYSVTVDGGQIWAAGQVPNADTMQFRDVHAFSADHAYLLGAGPGEMSRIYRTTDRGRTWVLQWVNPEERGFYDCFDFWDTESAVAYGDAIDGELRMVRTTDGESWSPVARAGLPAAHGSEGGFAASGTCMIALGESTGWVGTGAGVARVLRTDDRGATWTAALTPIVSNAPASGITSLAFWEGDTGMAFGGDLAITDEHTANVAVTNDGGRTWRLTSHPVFTGGIYGSDYVPGTAQPVVVVVGPGGADFTLDLGDSWTALDTLSYWAVGFASPSAGWAVGPGGRITKISLF